MNKCTKFGLRVLCPQLEASAGDMKSIYRIMFQQSKSICCETNDGFRIQTYTYAQIQQRICQAAAALYARVGAGHEYIALEMENSPDWIVAFWAILMSGNKPYLVNMRYPDNLSNNILKTLKIRYILCDQTSKLSGESICVGDLKGDHPQPPEDVFENELAFSSSATSMNEVVCFYSGPQVTEQILNFKQLIKENPRMGNEYKGMLKQLAFLPFYHIFGLFAVYFWFSFFGRTMVFLRDYSPETILKTCRRHNVTHIFAVPMLWHTIEKQVWAEAAKQGPKKVAQLKNALKITTALQNICPRAGANLSKLILRQVTGKLFGDSVMFCVSGGSYLRDSAMELLNGIGYCMHNGYGMSEIGITSVELRHRPKDRNRNSVGHPFQSVEYRLSEDGVLQVRGTSLCTRKLVNGEEVTLEEWFDTGDRMTCEDGHYYIHGRCSDTVIGDNGENINPDTVEKAFVIPHVQQFCVLGLPGENGQELALVAQIPTYTTRSMANKIKDYCYGMNNTFPAAMAVKKFYFTFDEISPPTAVKVSRAQLLRKIESDQVKLTLFAQFLPEETTDERQSPLLQQICQIVARVLEKDVSEVRGEAHIFYDLGATSMQYFAIMSELAKQYNIQGYSSGEAWCYTPQEACEYIERKLQV